MVALNEPNIMTVLEVGGIIPIGASDVALTVLMGMDGIPGAHGSDPRQYRIGQQTRGVATMAAAHRAAVEAIKSGPGDAKVGWSLAIVDLQAMEGGEARWEADRQPALIDWIEVSRDDDFIGVQTHPRERIGPEDTVPPPDDAQKMQTGWEVYPEALGAAARRSRQSERSVAADDIRRRPPRHRPRRRVRVDRCCR